MSGLDRIGDIAVNRRIFFSSPLNFNDPYDCAVGVRFSDSKNITINKSDIQRKTDLLIQEYGKNFGVFCVSETMESVAMWAHYAANHRGVIIEFDYAALVNLHANIRHFRVDYAESFPTFSDHKDLVDQLGEPKDNDKFIKLFFCRKSIEWDKEREWRFFTTPCDSYQDLTDSAITRIIFGTKMPETNKHLIQKWVQGDLDNIILSDAILSNADFKIIAEDRIQTGDHKSPNKP